MPVQNSTAQRAEPEPMSDSMPDSMPDPMMVAAEQHTAVDKALTLLKSLAEQDSEIGVSELARRTGLTKSTAFRLLGILQRNDIVERVGSDYRLGTQLFDIGTRVYGPTSVLLRERLLPYLTDLYELTHETVHLAVLHDAEILYVNKIQGHRAARSPSVIGSRLPAVGAQRRVAAESARTCRRTGCGPRGSRRCYGPWSWARRRCCGDVVEQPDVARVGLGDLQEALAAAGVVVIDQDVVLLVLESLNLDRSAVGTVGGHCPSRRTR